MVVPFFHNSVYIALGLAVSLAVALVVQLFALAQAKFDLDAAVLEIQRKRDERNAVLHDAGVELEYLALMHEQAARPDGVAVENIALLIRRDVHTADEKLTILHGAERILEIDVPRADRLDLRSGKLYPGLKALKHKVFMKSLAVAGYFLYALLLRHAAHSPLPVIAAARRPGF